MLTGALSIGIPYDLFWHLNPVKLKPFFDAERLKRKNQNSLMWINGVYTTQAVLTAMDAVMNGKKAKTEYFDEPIQIMPLTEAEKKEKIEVETQKLVTYLDNMEKQFNKGK